MSEDGMHDSITLRYTQAQGHERTIQPRRHFDSVPLGEHIKYIQDFITLCTDKAVTPQKITFYNRNVPVRMLDGSTRGQQPVEYRASPITSPTFARKAKPQYPLDLDYDAVGGVETIAMWIRTATEYATAVNLMTSFRSEMKSFVENRFLNVVGAAEAFHDLKHPGETQVQDTEWNQLQERMLSGYPRGTPRVVIQGTAIHKSRELA